MNKSNQHVIILLILILLFVGIGSAFAANPKYTIKFNDAKEYELGVYPALTTIGDVIIETHNNQLTTVFGELGHLLFRTGRLSDDKTTINWFQDGGVEYDRGYFSAVTVVGDTIVEVHQGENDKKLYCRTGKLVQIPAASNDRTIEIKKENVKLSEKAFEDNLKSITK
jgi:hypothetical protein